MKDIFSSFYIPTLFSGAVGAAGPAVPGNFQLSGRDSNSLDLSWQNPDLLTIRIEWKLTGADWVSLTGSDTVNATTYHISSLDADTAFDVRVRAEEPGGLVVSDWVILTGVYTGGQPPSSLAVDAGQFGEINVTWADGSVLAGLVSSITIHVEPTGLTFTGIDPGANARLITGLDAGATYTITVFSVGLHGGIAGTVSADLVTNAGAGYAPVNTTAPALSGDNFTLFVSSDWIGDPTPTLTYQWYFNSGVIAGATNNYLNPAEGDGGYYCKVTATNAVGSVEMDSDTYTVFTPP